MAHEDMRAAFKDSLIRLGYGQSVDDCLRAHPEHAEQLKPLLNDVLGIAGRLVRSTPEPEAEPVRQAGGYRWLLLMIPLLLLLVGCGLTLFLAQDSLPGEPLYGIKRAGEQILLDVLPDRNTIAEDFVERRSQEVAALIDASREAELPLRGEISTAGAERVEINGLSVIVGPQTAVNGPYVTGDEVEMQVQVTTAGQLVALSIRPLNPSPEVTPAFEATPETTAVPEATALPTDPDCSPQFFFGVLSSRCAVGIPVTARGLYQPFENGYMLRMAVPGADPVIYLFDANGTYAAYDDAWTGDVVDLGDPPAGFFAPTGNFAYLLADNPALQERIGWALEPAETYDAVTQPGRAAGVPDSPRLRYLAWPDDRVLEIDSTALRWRIVSTGPETGDE